jgi:hypothetical protein
VTTSAATAIPTTTGSKWDESIHQFAATAPRRD